MLLSGLIQAQRHEQIRHERRVELAFEAGLRFLDLKRWGTLVEAVDGLKAAENVTYHVEEHHALWPIPQSEIDYYAAHGVELRQNPGY